LDGVGLEGCGCQSSMGLGYAGLGQIDPVSAAIEIEQAIQIAKNFWDDLLAALGIHAGQREADAIVPLQNDITAKVLTPISANVQPGVIHNESCQELNSELTLLNQTETKWLDYLHNTPWVDGRAAQQAEATLAPYFIGLRKDLTDEIHARCSGILGGGIGLNNTTLIIGLGIAAIVILPKLMKRG
jgi:hypothetical protein